MFRYFVVPLFLLAMGPLASASNGDFFLTESEVAQRNGEDLIANSYFACLQDSNLSHLKTEDRALKCKLQTGSVIEELGGPEMQANWNWLICLEEQSSAHGTSYSSVVGLCRTLAANENTDLPAANVEL